MRVRDRTSDDGACASRARLDEAAAGRARRVRGRRRDRADRPTPASSRRRTPTTGSTSSTPLADALRRRGRRPVDRHAVRSAARRRSSRRSADVGHRARLPAVDRHRRAAARPRPAGSHRRFGVDVPTRADRRLHRHQGVRRHAAAVAAACARPSATPCCTRRVATRPTRWARSWPAAGRCRAVDDAVAARPRRDRRRPTPRGPCACGSTARATRPARSTTSARRRRGAGPTACRCSATSATSSSPGTAPPRTILEHGARRRRRRALAVEALEPRRRAGRLLRRRRRPRALPQRGAQARRDDGARARCRPPAVAALDDDAHVEVAARPLPRASGTDRDAAGRWSGVSVALPSGGFYLWVRRPRRRVGVHRAPRRVRGSVGQPRRVLRCARHVRVAVVQPDDRIDLVVQRLGG